MTNDYYTMKVYSKVSFGVLLDTQRKCRDCWFEKQSRFLIRQPFGVSFAGKPVDNCIIYLVNKDMRLVPQGEVGELIVAGRNLAAGYIRGRDAHKFVDNPHAIDPGERG